MTTLANKKKGPPKGKSNNPTGRPPLTQADIDLRNACKERTPAALAVIESIMMEGENERNKLQAAQFIIERAYGKAIQPQEVSGQLEIKQIIRRIIDPKND